MDLACGAGPAGVSTAVEAGRSGARVLLLEAHGSLGGVWTSGLLTWILDQANKTGFMREIEDRLRSKEGLNEKIKTRISLPFGVFAPLRSTTNRCGVFTKS